jgi:polyisoprenoid-binding protein YceI
MKSAMYKTLAATFFLLSYGAAYADASGGAPQPTQWQVDYAHSKIGFVGQQDGANFEGGFHKFNAQISLDPDHPETGKAVVTVDLASAYAGSSDRDTMLPQKEWFDTAKFPQAQFVSTSIRKTGPRKYEMDATLTIKGVTKNVTLLFTLSPSKEMGPDYTHADGRVSLMRTDFGVGTGSFSGEDYVKHGVDVVIDLEAK